MVFQNVLAKRGWKNGHQCFLWYKGGQILVWRDFLGAALADYQPVSCLSLVEPPARRGNPQQVTYTAE